MTIPAEIYSFGWQYALSIPAAVFVVFVTNYISLPVFYHNKVDNCYVVRVKIQRKRIEFGRKINFSL